MRLHRDQSQPYSDADLKREFGLTHDIRPVDDPFTGRRWSGNRIGFPDVLAVVEDTPAELARRLRADLDLIDLANRGSVPQRGPARRHRQA